MTDNMLWKDSSQDISFVLPEHVTLQAVNDEQSVYFYEEIFSKAFDQDSEATRTKV
jgi:hypothetical protein